MPAAKKSKIPPAKLDLYEKLIASVPAIERKGVVHPYTSENGHMFTYLDQTGTLGLCEEIEAKEEKPVAAAKARRASKPCAQQGRAAPTVAPTPAPTVKSPSFEPSSFNDLQPEVTEAMIEARPLPEITINPAAARERSLNEARRPPSAPSYDLRKKNPSRTPSPAEMRKQVRKSCAIASTNQANPSVYSEQKAKMIRYFVNGAASQTRQRGGVE
jgi:hypothetical protein